MSDCESLEVVWESLFSPGKKKRKKKVKPSPKKKTHLTNKTQGSNTTKKRKKNSKFKETKDERKAMRKEKKKKKKDKLAAELHDKIVNDNLSSLVNKTSLNLTQEAKKKRKRKKQVAFDIPQNHIRVKRPKFSSSFLPPLQDNTSLVNKDMVKTEIEPSQAKPSDSQSTSDDMHSQDLFITQKTFRVPLSEMSSEDASDKFEDHTKVAQIFYRETKCFFQTPTTKPKTGLCLETIKSSQKNSFLDAPIVVSGSPDGEKTTKDSIILSPLSRSGQQQKSMTSSFTQTENFFTTELTLYLNFCQKSKNNVQQDEIKPLDLSLPKRARQDLNTVTIDLCKDTKRNTSEGGYGGSGQPSWSMRAQGKGEETPSPQSESEQKSADTTTSSEDNEASRTSRLDLMQVRAVQMRLNESFFFKTKGEGPSPRAESPLMKLVQGREAKSRKSH